MREKKVIFECHLKPRFGEMRLDEITTPEVAKFRAALIARDRSGQADPRDVGCSWQTRGKTRGSHRVQRCSLLE
jgi:hypothetical protein